MKNEITIKNASESKKSLRKAFILSVVCLMLPGCVTHMDTCDTINGRWFQTTICMFYNAAYANGTNEITNSIKKIIIADKDNPTTGFTTSVENDIPAANDQETDPLQPIIADSQVDQHDAGEEDKIFKIKFPSLMRIAIMLVLILLIV